MAKVDLPSGVVWPGTKEEEEEFLEAVWAGCNEAYQMSCGANTKCQACQLMNNQDDLKRLVERRRYIRTLEPDARNRGGNETMNDFAGNL